MNTPAGVFSICLKVEETTPLEPGVREYKYYARGVDPAAPMRVKSFLEKNTGRVRTVGSNFLSVDAEPKGDADL